VNGNDPYAEIIREYLEPAQIAHAAHAAAPPASTTARHPAAGSGEAPAPPAPPRMLAMTASAQERLHELLNCRLATATVQERCGRGR